MMGSAAVSPPRRTKIDRRIFWLACGLALAACIAGTFVVGGPITADEVLYMSLSVNPYGDPHVLNRYFHTYLQGLFFRIVGDALVGARLYWSFIMSLTGLLIFVCATMLARSNRYFIGLLAVFIFLCQDLIWWNGVTYADFTSMMIVTLGCFCYLIYIRTDNVRLRYGLLLTLGLLIVVGFKSKEFTISLAALLVGLAWGEGKGRSRREVFGEFGLVAVGLVVGVAVIVALDWIRLADPLFSFRKANWTVLQQFHTMNKVRGEHWFLELARSQYLFLFALYLMAGGLRPKPEFSFQERVLWIQPLAVLGLLTLAILSVQKNPGVARHFAPAIPMMCVWAAQVFAKEPYHQAGERPGPAGTAPPGVVARLKSSRWNIIAIVLAAGLAPMIIWFFWLKGSKLGWTGLYSFSFIIVGGMGLCGLLALLSLIKRWKRWSVFLAALAVFVSFGPTGVFNAHEILVRRVVAKKVQSRFEPFTIFAKQIKYLDNPVIVQSPDFWWKYKMLGWVPNATHSMFTIYFWPKNLNRANVYWSKKAEHVLKGDYVWLTAADLEELLGSTHRRAILDRFLVKKENTGRFVLLIRRGLASKGR